MSFSSDTAVQIIGFVILFFMVRQSLDDWLATPLLEEVEVTGRRFFHAHAGNGRFGPTPDTWMLHVANDNGEGWVKVTQQDYEAVQQGDRFLVSGKKGRVTGRWYLGAARKRE